MKKIIITILLISVSSFAQESDSYFSSDIATNVNGITQRYMLDTKVSPINESILATSTNSKNLIRGRGFGYDGTESIKPVTCQLVMQTISVTPYLQLGTGPRQELEIFAVKVSSPRNSPITIPLLLAEQNPMLPIASSFGTHGVVFENANDRIQSKNGSDVGIYDFDIQLGNNNPSRFIKVSFTYQNVPRGKPLTKLLNMVVDELDRQEVTCTF